MHPGFVPSNHPNQQKKRGVDDSIDDRETPPDVFDPLNAEFGFTLDVAAARHNAKCKRYYALGPSTPAERRQCQLFPTALTGDPEALGYDGLTQPWGRDEVVWCNPPFSDLEPWVAKASSAECTVVMLLPANRTEQPFWQQHIELVRDGRAPGGPKVLFLPGRRSFLNMGEVIGNSTSKSPPFGIVIVIWDRRDVPLCPSQHSDDACCTACTNTTDGLGFPHPSEAKGRRQLQQCKHCSDWVEPKDWVNDTEWAWFGCASCDQHLNHASRVHASSVQVGENDAKAAK